jgi:hypothetical protein
VGVLLTWNALSVSWRIALAAAEDALDAGTECLPGEEVRARRVGLGHEREQIKRLLGADARADRVVGDLDTLL